MVLREPSFSTSHIVGYDGESSRPLPRSNSATRARIAVRRSSPNVRASARARARLADAARCRASGMVCNDNNAGANPTTIDYKNAVGESGTGKKDAEKGAHHEANNDDHLVLPRIVCSGLRRISWCSLPGVVCLAPDVLASSTGKFGGVFVIW
jgi:hypothetical protein